MQHLTKSRRPIWMILAILLVFSLLAGTAGCSIPLKSDAESSQSTKPDQAKETKQETEADSQAATEPEGETGFALSVDEPYVSEGDGVLFTVRAGGRETVTLLRDGKAVGSLKDDGTDGDETAGDGVYSLFVQDPVPEGQEAVYKIEQGESVTVYLFGSITEEERARAEETQLKIRGKLEALPRCDWKKSGRRWSSS